MVDMNFVPEDYTQNSESRRTNFLYLALLGLVMVALGGSFMTIKLRQRAFRIKGRLVDAKVAQAHEDINRFEQLQENRKVMMKAALTTMQLLEPVPRSVLLASLTNSLPLGVSLVRLNLIQKEPKQAGNLAAPANKYREAQAKKATTAQAEVTREKLLETHIDIDGLAPSDRQVAAYITRLRSTSLLDNVALVEIKEHKVEDRTFRKFKLTAILRKDVHLSSEDVVRIREEGRNAARIF